jgi:O-antigen/teichoic acid export membrane protein
MTDHPPKKNSRRFASNLVAVLASDILNKGATFLVYILVARKLGAYAFGQMSLALTLFYSFQVIAAFGMQTLITREVAKDPQKAGAYFAGSLLVGLLASLGATFLLVVAVIALDYPVDTRNVILITALGLIPFAIANSCQAVIRGWEKMHLIAYIQVPINVLKVVATYVLLCFGGDIFQVVVITVLAQFLIGLASLIITLRHLQTWSPGFWDLSFAWSVATRSTTFVGCETVTAWWTSLNIVLLSKMANETDVGLYNAAMQLMIPMGIFYQSVMVAAFPIMCRKFLTGPNGLAQVSSRLLELLMIIAIPGTVGLCMVAEPALEFVFNGKDFLQAAWVVRIVAVILIMKAFTFALGHILLAGNRELTTLRIVVVDLIFNLILGWILILYFGLIGAAVSALLSRVVDTVQHLGPVRRIVAQLDFGRLVWKPVVASLIMAVYLYGFRSQPLPLLVTSAVVVYFAVLMAFESWMVGGIRNLPARYF